MPVYCRHLSRKSMEDWALCNTGGTFLYCGCYRIGLEMLTEKHCYRLCIAVSENPQVNVPCFNTSRTGWYSIYLPRRD